MTRTSTLRFGTALMASASSLCFAAPALAGDVLFSTMQDISIEDGARINQIGGLTQVRLNSGAIVSFVEAANYRINADDSVDLYAGSVTVAGSDGTTVVRMPNGVEGRVSGVGSGARFTVGRDGEGAGHVLTGSTQIGRNGDLRRFASGEMFEIAPGERARRVVSNGAQTTPGAQDDEPQVAAMDGDTGPVAAAQNGIPVTLGDALAAAGASSDILGAARRVEAAAANPTIDTFPIGDLQLLVALAGDLGSAYGGTPFPGAQADIVRTYLQFLANGGAGQNFLSVYAGFLTQYLNLVRSGAAPSGFPLASLDQINSFIAFTGRTGGFGGSSAQDRALIDAYLAFIRAGGNADAFAGSFIDLTTAYFAFVRAGGNPADFAGASQATIDAYIAFLSDSGLIQQLSAVDRALVAIYLQNGGLTFAAEYRLALDAYFAFLAAGNLPSDYSALDPATLQAYLQTLQGAGLLGNVLGDRADFFTAYLAYLQGGGQPDAFGGLNATIFAGYASALAAYYDYLAKGGIPSGYSALTQQQIAAYVAALQGTGATDRFLIDLAEFYTAYLVFLDGGGNPDNFAGLPVPPDFPAFAAALNAYAAFLAAGGLPGDYAAADLALLQGYLDAIVGSGQLAGLLGGNANLLQTYFAYLAGGGAPNLFSGLPVYADYVAALNAYYAFLAAGGLPGDYTVLTQGQIRSYLDALTAAGGFVAYGNLDAFFGAYYTFLASGGAPADFSGIPVYADYLAALRAYYDYLAAGGLPSGYTLLTQAEIEDYLVRLRNSGVLQASLTADELQFVFDYLAYIQSNDDPDRFAGLPANNPGVSLASGANGWIFGTDGGRVGVATTADVTDDGRITRTDYTTPSGSVNFDFIEPGNTIREFGRIGNAVAWTRYERGAAAGGITNSNVHLLLGSPAINLPANGTLQYRLAGGTAPTDAFAPAGEIGSFEGNLSVLFGTIPLVGLDFDVYVGTRGWHAQTTGGAADPANGGLAVNGDMRFESTNNLQRSGIAGDACTGFCSVNVFGGLFGDGANGAGFQYFIDDQSGGASKRSYVNGVAVFGNGGPEFDLIGEKPTSGGDGGGGGTGGESLADGVLPAALAGNPFAFVYGTQVVGIAASQAVENGGLVQTSVAGGRGAYQFNDAVTAASISSDGDAGVVGWSRFTDAGAVTVVSGTGQAFQYSLPANFYLHNVWGLPVVDQPTSGTASYSLLSASVPTQGGRTQPGDGAFDGSLVVDFATTKVGIMGNVTYDGFGYTFASTGGVATPSLNIRADNLFDGLLATQRSDGSNVSRGTQVFGFLSGDAASHAGLVYNVQIASNAAITGAAIFGRGDISHGVAGGAPPTGSATIGGNLYSSSRFGRGRNPTTASVSADGTITDGVVNWSGEEAVVAERGRYGDAVAWTRYDYDSFANSTYDGSAHLLIGTPTIDMPASGKVDYYLVGGTAPTNREIPGQVGTMSGAAAVWFGTQSRIGFDFQVDLGEFSYRAHTHGGTADIAGAFVITNGNRFNNALLVDGLNDASCKGNCGGNALGEIYGDGATHIGLSYRIEDSASPAGNTIWGVAAFGTVGTKVDEISPSTSASAGNAQASSFAAGFAPLSSPGSAIDMMGGPKAPPQPPQPPVISLEPWTRWEASSTASSQPGGQALPLPIAARNPATPGSTNEAERLFGGRITFGKAVTP